MKRGLALFLIVVAAGTLLSATGAGVPGAIAGARLTAISSRVHSKGASLVIEATDPVGYVAARPDPLTITIDFRNVAAGGVVEFRRVECEQSDCRRLRGTGGIARRARRARAHHAVAAGRAPRPQRSQRRS